MNPKCLKWGKLGVGRDIKWGKCDNFQSCAKEAEELLGGRGKVINALSE